MPSHDILAAHVARNLVLEREVVRISCALGAIPHAFIKGIVLARLLYDRVGDRQMLDIDLLVKSDDVEDARSALESVGYRDLGQLRMHQNVDEAYQSPLHRVGESGLDLVIDLHWELVDPTRFQLPHGEIWPNLTAVRLRDRPVPTLDPLRTMLHLAIHDVHHACRAPHIQEDVRRAVDAWGDELDWHELDRLARQAGAQHALPFSLTGAGTSHRCAATMRSRLLNKLFRSPRPPRTRRWDLSGLLLQAAILTPRNSARLLRQLVLPPRYVVGTALDVPTADVRPRHYVLRMMGSHRRLAGRRWLLSGSGSTRARSRRSAAPPP